MSKRFLLYYLYVQTSILFFYAYKVEAITQFCLKCFKIGMIQVVLRRYYDAAKI